MTTPLANAIWRPCENLAVVASPDGARFAVLELDAVQPIFLEDSAAAIWRAVAEPGTAAQITARVAAEYGVAPTDVAPTVGEFLESLRSQGLATTDADE